MQANTTGRNELTLKFMNFLRKKAKQPIPLGFYIILLFLLFIILFQILLTSNLPKSVPIHKLYRFSHQTSPKCKNRSQNPTLSQFGEMMVSMLPQDLPFTLFVPSKSSFEKTLKLKSNESLIDVNLNNTFAIVSRVLGFSAVPKQLPAGGLDRKKEKVADSVSGFKLYLWKDFDGMIVVNGVRSECVDLKIGEVIVHLMNGVLMDPEFEQSFIPDYED
ncbi:hypothetical protein LUZ60_015239 [Juncus effusus]|nr:hypothetical protein LUZ60_015239 [Juncus effusus]